MRKLLTAALGVGLVLTLAPAQADTMIEEGRYDVTIGNPAVGLTVNGTCPDVCFGGFTFAAPGVPLTKVVVKDTSGTPIGVVVGQNLDGDTTSGEAGEPRAEGCGGTIGLLSSTVPFDGNLPVAVFVHAVNPVKLPATPATNPIGLGCAGIGTSGTIELWVEE